MRVLIAHSFYRLPGGEDRYVRQQLELLQDHHEVHLLQRSNDDLRSGIRAGARVVFSRREMHEVEDVVRRFRPDVVHLHNAYPSLGSGVPLVAKKHGLPLVMTVHNFRLRCPNGFGFTQGRQCNRCEGGMYLNAMTHGCFPSVIQAGAYATALWLHRFVLRLEDRIDLFICPSEHMATRLAEWGIDSKRISVVRNFTTASNHSPAAPGRYGIYVGRLSAEKGLIGMLRALRQAGDPPFHIVGDGPLEGGLRKTAADLGLKGTVFLGRLATDQVETELRAARFFVMPSLWEENAPMSALEAMAAGRPLLVADIGGLPELVRGGAGLTFGSADVGELARKVKQLMGDDAFCVAAGERALAVARADFSPASHRAALELEYRKITA